METLHPSESSWEPPSKDSEGELGRSWVLCGALMALPTVYFHLKEGDPYSVFMGLPVGFAGESEESGLRRVAELSSESHVLRGQPMKGKSVTGANASGHHASRGIHADVIHEK